FIMIISAFNIIATLSMLILDKKKDIQTLISLGATNKMVRQIFIIEGLIINFMGAFLGMAVGLITCWAQIKFHLITIENSVVEYWPVVVEWQDVLVIFAMVFFTGIITSVLPVSLLIKRHFNKMFERN